MVGNFIKTSVKCLTVCAWMLQSSGVWAQESEYTPLSGDFDFLAVRNIKISTIEVLDHGTMVFWDGDGLHTGTEQLRINLFNCKDIPKNIALPDDPKFICKIKDMDGNLVTEKESSVESTFNRLRFVRNLNTNFDSRQLVKRGGKYVISAEITPDLFYYETEILLPDDPCIHVFDKESTVDTLLCPQIFLSGGYPYNPSDFSGAKHLHWQIAATDAPDAVIEEKDETFELKSESADLAPVGSVRLDVANLRPGKYIYTITSDFAPANYSFTATVEDVLDPEITLDKESYTAGESKEAIIKVDMNYGYPYVGAGSSSDKPTVTVNAVLLDEETSVSYSDEAWVDSHMHCMAEVKVPLEKVTAEAVSENKGEFPLHLSILFNDTTKYETTLPLHFERGSSGIHGINADNSDKSKVRYFNILGVEVDESYRGLVISSDGKKIIR